MGWLSKLNGPIACLIVGSIACLGSTPDEFASDWYWNLFIALFESIYKEWNWTNIFNCLIARLIVWYIGRSDELAPETWDLSQQILAEVQGTLYVVRGTQYLDLGTLTSDHWVPCGIISSWNLINSRCSILVTWYLILPPLITVCRVPCGIISNASMW